MNRQQFIDYIKSPEKLNEDTAIKLEEIVREYPYCQTADILYAANLCKENHIKFNDQLKVASAYAADRKILKQLINSVRTTDHPDFQTKSAAKPKKTDKVRKSEVIKESNLSELINLLTQEINLVQIKSSGEISDSEKDNLNRLTEKLELLLVQLYSTSEPQQDEQPSAGLKSEYNFDHLEELSHTETSDFDQNKLIEKFIKEEPKIAPVSKSSFFDPVDFAKQSLVDNDNVVSETLAEIYYKQGNLAKALKIYKKLSLENPE